MHKPFADAAVIDRSAALRQIATWLDAETEALAAAAVQRMREREPDLCATIAGQGFQALADVRALIGALSEALRRELVSAADAGRESAAPFAVAAARGGADWPAVAAAWSCCQAEIADAALAYVAAADWGDPDRRVGVMAAVASALLSFDSALTAALAAAYHQARDRIAHRAERALGAHIDELLARPGADVADLGIDLDRDHVALIAWGGDSHRAVEALAAELGCEVTVEQRRDALWAWLHGAPAIRAEALIEARSFAPPEGTSISLGDVHAGREGFVTSHHEARSAQRVGAMSGAAVTFFGDVGLEAFALADESLARGFVARELGPLAADDARAAALRETLEAYFAAGNSASGAASTLNVHERTVSYRVRAAEQRLGRYLIDCQDEVALALRLYSLFSGAASRPPKAAGAS